MSFTAGVLTFVALLAAPSDGLRLLSQGQTELQRGKFEQALRHLQEASEVLTEPKERARAELLMGQCYAARRDFAHVEDAFGRALATDPEATLDVNLVDPTLVAMLEGMRQRRGGTLALARGAAGTRAFLDGTELSPLPWSGPISVGRHRVRWLFHGDEETQELVVHVQERLALAPSAKLAPSLPEAPSQPAPAPKPSAPVASARVEVPHQAPWGHATLEARGLYDIGHGAGVELGVGIEWRLLFGALDVTWGHAVGTTLRLGVRGESLLGPVGGYLSVDGVAFFPGEADLGIGGTAGISVTVHPAVELFIEGSGRWLEAQPAVANQYWLLGLGVRGRIALGGR